jgi:two-component system, chemotaxis family, chemotaxis protein CheY
MRTKTVLLVEDDLDVRDLLQDYLEAKGFDVIPAGTGKQALDFLLTEGGSPPDIVILDLMMPLVNGWQVLERMRNHPALAGIPVVVLTAATSDKPTGASAVVRKPFQPDALVETMRGYLERRASFAGS